jgi:hypothetical protein
MLMSSTNAWPVAAIAAAGLLGGLAPRSLADPALPTTTNGDQPAAAAGRAEGVLRPGDKSLENTINESLAGQHIEPDPGSTNPFLVGADRLAEPRRCTLQIAADDAPSDRTKRQSKFGPVYVLRGKMPTFPNAHAGGAGKNLTIMPDAQTQYWSVVSCEAAPSGQVVDGLTDSQVPLDAGRNYTIVVSRAEDRPQNATEQHGVAWLNWGTRGEGLDDPRNRTDFGMLMLRKMANNPTWTESPDHVTKPGTEEAVMGPYYPRGYYTTKVGFETEGVRKYTIDNTRNMRFGEILVVKERVIEVYNTTGLNDCPPELWNALPLDKIKEQFGALRVLKNGPHYWMMDSQSVSLGEKVSFGGLEARWAAKLNPGAAAKAAQGSEPYKVFLPKKTQKMVYSKGKPVYELVDPDGNVYVLQAHDEQFSLEALPKLGERLKKLPDGWKYRTRILTEDLVLDLKPDQTIHAVGDEFHQYYTRIPGNK